MVADNKKIKAAKSPEQSRVCFGKKIRAFFRRPVLLVILAAIFFALLPVRQAAAQTAGIITGIIGKALGWVAFVINYILAWIASVFIMVEAWAIGVILKLNSGLVNADIVQSGFGVTLSLANLGFVAAIIIIAIATILRLQTYGIKQILWKLIVAALLVNFSLVIAGTILDFADRLTNYFLESGFPQGTVDSHHRFATRIATVFRPQQFLLTDWKKVIEKKEANPAMPDEEAAEEAAEEQAAELEEITSGLADISGTALGSILPPVFSVWTAMLGLIMIIVVLGILGVMLLIRYVALAILMILMPLAWLAWIFPGLAKHWSSWWSSFFRWTFFAPLALFFMWLVIMTGATMAKTFNFESSTSPGGGDFSPASSALSIFLTGALAPSVATLLNATVLIGIMIGGLVAANKLSILGASWALETAKGAGRGFGRVTARGGKKVGARLAQSKAGQAVSKQAQQLAGRGRMGARIMAPFVKGMEAARVAGGEKLVAEAEERQKKMTSSQLINTFSVMNKEGRMAAAKRLLAEKRLSEVDPGLLKRTFGEDKEEVFKRSGQEKLFKDVRGQSGLELDRLRGMLEGAKTSQEKDATMGEIIKHFQAAPDPGLLAETFFQDLGKLKAEGRPIPLGLDDTSFAKMQELVARGVAQGFSPQNTSEFFQNLSRGDQLNQFKDVAVRAKIQEAEISPRLENWLNSSGARNLGIGREMFGLVKEPLKKPPPQKPYETPL